MTTYYYIVKTNLLNQIRSYKFLLISAVSVFLGILCVPAANAGYEVIYLDGVRGIYNSAWLGAVGALLPSILLWLPGFYLLRSQISEDNRLKIGDMIASTPISRFRYISGKVMANFAVLATLALIFLFALIGMQIIRQEETAISLLQFIQPFFIITVPSLLILASLSVMFDVLCSLKGILGNITIFGLWVTLVSTSVITQKCEFDLLGIGTTLTEMMQNAQKVYPQIHSATGSLGFNITNGITPTFIFSGTSWNTEFLISRFIWIGISFFIIFLSSCLFDRFRKMPVQTQHNFTKPRKTVVPSGIETENSLSPVHMQNFNLFKISRSELKIILTGYSVWWYLAIIFCIILSIFLPFQNSRHFISLIMLLPIPIWAQMGCRENYFFTSELVKSSCALTYKRLAEWLAGMSVTLFISSGVLLQFILLNDWAHLTAWIVGTVFITTLAFMLGCMSGKRKLFEAVYITWFYFGPMNGTELLDFWGISQQNTELYFIFSCVLALITYFYTWNIEKHAFTNTNKRSKLL